MEYYTINIDLTMGTYRDKGIARMELERVMNNLLDSEDICDWELNDLDVLTLDEDY